MREGRRKFRKNSSGQLLIVAALAIAIIISSTTIYVYELSKETNSTYTSPSINNFILALKQSTRNTVVGSLANISNGGEKTALTANLNELSQVFRDLNYFEICQLDFIVFNGSNYDSGIWLSWNTSDLGVSSAYADFMLKVYSTTANVTTSYAVNITTIVTISGNYTELVGNEKLVNLTCKIYNEGEPALAKNISLFYEKLGSWIPVDSSNNLSINDYGNGTYAISFTVDVPSDQVLVSAHVYDLRDIFVRANTTCSQV
jgi:hypothetical protein